MITFKRKAISLMLAVLLIVTYCPIVLPVAAAEQNSIIIHYYSETPNPCIYYWNSLPENIVTDYPGVAMIADSQQGDNWYTYTFDGCTKINMIFTNSDGSQVTGEELTRTTGEWWYKNNVWKKYNPDETDPYQLSDDLREDTVYSLMITRFYDGDTNNNVHCWDGSQAGDSDIDPAWQGDFKGLIEKLDYIKALGFSAVMLNPVAQNASGYDYHGEHPVNLMEIDSRYESEGYTYDDLIEACHAKGIKVIQKVILNSTGSYGESNLFPLFEVNEEADASNEEERMVPTNMLLNAWNLNSSKEYWAQLAKTQFEQRLHLMKNTDYSTDNICSTGELPVQSDYNISKLSNSATFNPLNYYHSGYFPTNELNDWRSQFGQITDNSVDLNTENPYVGEYLAKSILMYARKGVDAVNIDCVNRITRLSLDVNIIKPLKEMLAEENLDIEIFGDALSGDNSVEGVWNKDQAILSAPFYTWNKSDAELTGKWSTGTSKEDINNNMNLAFEFIKNNNDVSNQPTSDNAFLNGIEYHTPDYKEKFLNMQDSPMMNNFGNAQTAFSIAKSGDEYYNDATWNMTMFQDVDYSFMGAVRSSAGTQNMAEQLDFMFTFRGIPTVFYGDEVEFKKGEIIDSAGNEPLSNTGHAYYGDWLDGNVTATDFSEYTASGTVADTLGSPLSKHIQKLNQIRRAIPALQKGQYTTNSNYVLGNMAFIRRYKDETVDSLALITISGGATFKNIPNGTYIDAVTGNVQSVTNGTLTVPSPGKANMRVYVCCASGFTGIDGQIGGVSDYLKSRYSITANTAASSSTTTTASSNAASTMTLNSSGVEAYAVGDVVYCQNDAGWSTVNCFMYNSSDASNNNGMWPGKTMTHLGDGLWKYVIENDSLDMIIFNDGSATNLLDELSFNGNNGLYNNLTKEWGKYSSLVIKSLVTDLASPQYTQTDIVITATAKTDTNTEITYKFSVDGTVIQDYSPNNTCIWTPETSGTKSIKVEVKDEAGNTNEKNISYGIMDYSAEVRPILKGVSPKEGTCIELNKSTNVTINAGGGNTGTKLLFYKYIITAPDDNRINTPYYTLNPSFSFTPEVEGRYTVKVYVQSSDNTTVSRSLVYNSVKYMPNEEGIFEIQNASQLNWFANKVNNDNASFGNAKAVLTNNIILNSGDIAKNDLENTEVLSEWTPIGNSSNKFTGTFDGQGHTISGLYINSDSTDYVGLFGYVGAGGTVSNLGVVNSYFAGSDNVGSVCGYNEGIITGCYSIASINGVSNAGGVCGYSAGGAIANCYFNKDYYVGEAVGGSDDSAVVSSNVQGKTTDQFKCGEVAYLLSQGCTIGEGDNQIVHDGSCWGQKLGEAGDAFPVSKQDGNDDNTIYQYTNCDGTVTYTNDSALSGTTVEHKDENGDDLCDNCNRASCTIKLYNRTNDDVKAIYDMPALGKYFPGQEVTVIAADKSEDGYEFLGWYKVTDSTDTDATAYDSVALTKKLKYTFSAEPDVRLVAVYHALGKAQVTINVVNGAKYYVGSDTTAKQGTTENVKLGSKLVLTALDSERVYQWQNESGKVLGTGSSLSLTVTGNTSVTLVYSTTDENAGYIQFLSDFGQVISATLCTASTKELLFPEGPSKFGYTFKYWTMDGTSEAKLADITSAIAAGSKLVTLTPYYSQNEMPKVSITVKKAYNGTSDNENDIVYSNLTYGSTMTITEVSLEGYIFKCWASDVNGENILSYDKDYFVQATINQTIYAIFVEPESEVKAQPVITITDLSTIEDGSTHKISCAATRNVPDGYTLIEQGMLYGVNLESLTKDTFVYGTENVRRYISSDMAASGIFRMIIEVSSDSKDVYYRGYMIVKNNETGNQEYIYTDITYGSYNSINNIL